MPPSHTNTHIEEQNKFTFQMSKIVSSITCLVCKKKKEQSHCHNIRWAAGGLKQALKAVERIVADSWPSSAKSIWRSHLQLEDSDAVPVVPQLLLKLRDGLLQRHDLLLPLLVLMQPVGNLVRAAKHIRTFLLVQLRQCGHQPTHPIPHHLLDDKQLLTSRPAVAQQCHNIC